MRRSNLVWSGLVWLVWLSAGLIDASTCTCVPCKLSIHPNRTPVGCWSAIVDPDLQTQLFAVNTTIEVQNEVAPSRRRAPSID